MLNTLFWALSANCYWIYVIQLLSIFMSTISPGPSFSYSLSPKFSHLKTTIFYDISWFLRVRIESGHNRNGLCLFHPVWLCSEIWQQGCWKHPKFHSPTSVAIGAEAAGWRSSLGLSARTPTGGLLCGLCFLTTWGLAFKGKCPERHFSWPSLRSHTTSLLPHSGYY